jgi:hypothetical protein
MRQRIVYGELVAAKVAVKRKTRGLNIAVSYEEVGDDTPPSPVVTTAIVVRSCVTAGPLAGITPSLTSPHVLHFILPISDA